MTLKSQLVVALAVMWYTVMTLSFQTFRLWQTVKTQIRLLLGDSGSVHLFDTNFVVNSFV